MSNSIKYGTLERMEMVVALGIFFIFVTIAFFVIAFFFPEWVGITGSKAKEVIESHAGDSAPDDEKKKS